MLTPYRRKQNPDIDAEFAQAEPFGNVKLGKTRIYCRRLLKWQFIPVSEVTRAYRRIEEAKGRTGCCSNDFSSHFLMLVTRGGSTEKLKIGEELYRGEPEALMEKFRQLYPDIPTGTE